MVQSLEDETNTGFHVKHTRPAPLTDGNAGARGFECIACSDSNPELLIVETFTDSSATVVAHQLPQFAGRIQVEQVVTPPLGWFCITSCMSKFMEEIAVDGLAQIEKRGGRTTHPLGAERNLNKHPGPATKESMKPMSCATSNAVFLTSSSPAARWRRLRLSVHSSGWAPQHSVKGVTGQPRGL